MVNKKISVQTFRLPTELWEKIWTMTQTPFRRRFEAGTRSKSGPYVLIEKERLDDLFGAAGNLHMMLFEILFKNPHILKVPAMVEFSFVSGSSHFGKTLFGYGKLKLFEKISRFFVLDGLAGFRALSTDAARDEDAESVDAESVSIVALNDDGIMSKIRNGVWSLDEITIKNTFLPKIKMLTFLPEGQGQRGFFVSYRDDGGQVSIFNPRT